MLRAGCHRLYSDFLLPDRLPEYRRLLQGAVDRGYELHSISSYRRAREEDPRPVNRLILRRDVDTDVETAGRFFEVEREFEGRASYFFRLSTADPELMRRIESAGGEAGYHYEEIATAARERGFRSRREVEANLPLIRERFRRNLTTLRRATGLPIRIVAAHGDMANRALGVGNRELLDDVLRAELGIEAEAYDRGLTPGIKSWISDDAFPRFWNPHAPDVAFERGDRVVYLLMHPRHWRRNVRENLVDDLRRLATGVRLRGASEAGAGADADLVFTQRRAAPFEPAQVAGASFRFLSGPADGLRMARALRHRFGAGGFAKSLTKLATGSRFLYCVVENGRIAHDGWLLAGADGVVIGPIDTDPAARGRSLAPYGLQLAMNAMLSRGHRVFVIQTSPRNDAGRRVIEKCGFEPA